MSTCILSVTPSDTWNPPPGFLFISAFPSESHCLPKPIAQDLIPWSLHQLQVGITHAGLWLCQWNGKTWVWLNSKQWLNKTEKWRNLQWCLVLARKMYRMLLLEKVWERMDKWGVKTFLYLLLIDSTDLCVTEASLSFSSFLTVTLTFSCPTFHSGLTIASQFLL